MCKVTAASRAASRIASTTGPSIGSASVSQES